MAAASKLIQGSDPGMTITNESVGDQVVLTVAFTPQRLKERQGLAIEQNITTLRNRVNELGVSEPIVNRQGVDRIVVQLPGVQDPNQAVRVLGATATVEFRLVDEANNPYEAESSKRVPIGSKLYKETDGRPILLKRDVIATGEQLTDATSRFPEGAPEVGVTLDARGGQEMLEATRDNVGRRMAVVYIETKSLAEGEICKGARSGDVCTEENVINAATIQSVLSSSFRITGLQSAEAHELALLLRSGALAAPQRIVEQRSIGPSLGKDNIVRGLRALAVGAVLTFIFLAIYYRWFGMVANVILLTNVVLLVALMSVLPGAALSLPGIAGVVLTIGMAADANVLIFERIREEVRNGNSPHAAIAAGFDKAFSAIADSNVTTLIAGIVLFAFGTGPIKGFAVTLVLGIFTSLFTAVVVQPRVDRCHLGPSPPDREPAGLAAPRSPNDGILQANAEHRLHVEAAYHVRRFGGADGRVVRAAGRARTELRHRLHGRRHHRGELSGRGERRQRARRAHPGGLPRRSRANVRQFA